MIGDYYYEDIDDKEEAIKYYKRVSELGYERAAERLSRILPKGEGPKNEALAPALETLPFPAAAEDSIDDLTF